MDDFIFALNNRTEIGECSGLVTLQPFMDVHVKTESSDDSEEESLLVHKYEVETQEETIPVNKNGNKTYLKVFRQPLMDNVKVSTKKVSFQIHEEEDIKIEELDTTTEVLDIKGEQIGEEEEQAEEEDTNGEELQNGEEFIDRQDIYFNSLHQSLQKIVSSFNYYESPNNDFQDRLDRKKSLRQKKNKKLKYCSRCYEYRKLENKLMDAFRKHYIENYELNLILRNGKQINLITR